MIKKYENNIGDSIENVGGDLTYRDHWLPYLDNVIEKELVKSGSVPSDIKEIVDQELDSRGVTQEAVDAWNAALLDISGLDQRVEALENLPCVGISQEQINAWNSALMQMNNLEQRVEDLEDLTSKSCIWKEQN